MDATVKKLYDAIDLHRKKPVPPDVPTTHYGATGYDPMSPYPVITSRVRYANIADVINNKGYPAVYPQSYTPVPDYFKRFNITPYFNPGEDVDYAKGSLTIAGMVDLNSMKAPWSLQREQDIAEVLELARAYNRTLTSLVNVDMKVKAYIPRLQALIKVLEKGYKRVLKKHGKLELSSDIVDLLRRMVR